MDLYKYITPKQTCNTTCAAASNKMMLSISSSLSIGNVNSISDPSLKQRHTGKEKGPSALVETNGKIVLKRVGEMLKKIENGVGVGTVSSYDTAWVGMVPSEKEQPLFPECLNWLMENQQPDGSWSVFPHHPLLVKDSLSSTLASVLALQRWNLAPRLVHNGLDYIASNMWAATDNHQQSPLGFDLLFPSMVHQANNLGINLDFNTNPSLDNLLTNPLLNIQSLETSQLAYFAEGLTKLEDWRQILKYQRSNGSLFNSPSTTAAAAIHLRDEKCLSYLDSLIKQYSNGGVPTIYPMDVHTRISIIDNLGKLGLERYFPHEIRNLLDQIFRLWKEGSEEIFINPASCATGFRLLRKYGYDVSSDSLALFDKKENIEPQLAIPGHQSDTKSAFELFKASQMKKLQNEPVLDRIYEWTTEFLREKLVENSIEDKSLCEEVKIEVGYPYANLDRLETRSYIANYDPCHIPLLKTSYRPVDIDERDLLTIARQDFNMCQAKHREELDYLDSWVKRYKLDTLSWARQKTAYGFFCVAAILSEPKYADARISWAQNTVFVTIVDDFFDYGGSIEELHNLIALMHSWENHLEVGFKSEKVKIIFYAMYGTLNELADKAEKQQGRSVRRHLVDIWIRVMKCMLKEAEWARYNMVPTMFEYLGAGHVSIGLGPVFQICLYFMGCPITEDVVASVEYERLYVNVSVIARLLNDRVTVKRESAEGKLNGVSLLVEHGRGHVDEEKSMREVENIIETHKRELLRVIVNQEDSIVPQPCKDLAWRVSKVLHLLYFDEDGFTCPYKMVDAVNAIVNQPILYTP